MGVIWWPALADCSSEAAVAYKLAVTVHRCLQHRASRYLTDYCVPKFPVVSIYIYDLSNVFNCLFHMFAAARLEAVLFLSPGQRSISVNAAGVTGVRTSPNCDLQGSVKALDPYNKWYTITRGGVGRERRKGRTPSISQVRSVDAHATVWNLLPDNWRDPVVDSGQDLKTSLDTTERGALAVTPSCALQNSTVK